MTDTGQVPGEGLPESAGTVEQPGVPAHGAYTYLSESPAEDEDLLLPGHQGAWGHEVPPPAPEPVAGPGRASQRPATGRDCAGRAAFGVGLSVVRASAGGRVMAVSALAGDGGGGKSGQAIRFGHQARAD
nr:hypothetical protein [Streptomyces mexicanus]